MQSLARSVRAAGHLHGENRSPDVHLASAAVATAVGAAVASGAAYLGAKVPLWFNDLKDGSLKACGEYSAMATAAYETTGSKALQTLRGRNVLSSNWCVDEDLSSDCRKVFHNVSTGQTVIAERGTSTLWDLGVDVNVCVGREEQSRRFADAMEVATKVIEKYGPRNVLCTGHSLGGGIADYVGRYLRVPSVQFNPGIGLRAFTQQPPAVSSTSFCTFWDPWSRVHQTYGGDSVVHRIAKKAGTLGPHTIGNFLQEGCGHDASLNVMQGLGLLRAIMTCAGLSAQCTGELINCMVSEASRMSRSELNKHVTHGTIAGVLAGSAAGAGAAGVGSIAVETTGLAGMLGCSTTASVMVPLAEAAGTTVAGAAATVALPVAVLTAGFYVAKQFGNVPLTAILDQWFKTHGNHECAFLVHGSVRNDCNLITKINNGSKWKGLSVPKGALAFRSSGIMSSLALMTPYSRLLGAWDVGQRTELGKLTVDGYEFTMFRAPAP